MPNLLGGSASSCPERFARVRGFFDGRYFRSLGALRRQPLLPEIGRPALARRFLIRQPESA
jgi:hypothetical protein